MNIVILGATGGTGIELIKQTIEAGHSVTALVRDPKALKPFAERIQVKTGNLLDQDELAAILHGQDAVLSGFGPRVPLVKTDAHLLREFATALTAAMQNTGVRRLVTISTAFLFRDSIIPPTYLIGRLFFSSVVTDSADLEAIVKRSDLDWTIVRPPQLTDGSITRNYRERIEHLPRFGFKISRADVADYFVKILPSGEVTRKVVGISN
ncbi:MAG TPA: SDR family oxidoreductase [Acidobacteriaceae bacterium]|jgi:putative NADH-flavin reductase